jgi:predicted secreted hydrolase
MHGTEAAFLRREGIGESPEPWEDGMRTDARPGTFEWWYFDAQFEDGSAAVVVFMTKPIYQRNDPLTPAIILTITKPDGERLTDMPIFLAGQFSAARDGCEVNIGQNWVRGDLQDYQLHAETTGLVADLSFTSLVPPWRPGAGKNYYDQSLQKYFAWLAAIPFGKVEGHLTYDGVTREVRGTGYHDHNWSTIGIEQVTSHWYWGRAHLEGFTTIFVEYVHAKRYGSQRSPVFFLAKGSQILTGDGQPLTLQARDFFRHPSGKEFPRQLDFFWQKDAEIVHIGLNRPQVMEATSLLSTLPFWKQRLARLFANPYYFRFKADMEMTVKLAGIDTCVQGPAIYELMMFR